MNHMIPDKYVEVSENIYYCRNNPLAHDWYFTVHTEDNNCLVYCCSLNGNIYDHSIKGSDIRHLREHFPVAVKQDGRIELYHGEMDACVLLWHMAGSEYSDYCCYILDNNVEIYQSLLLIHEALLDESITKGEVDKLFFDIFGARIDHYKNFLKLSGQT